MEQLGKTVYVGIAKKMQVSLREGLAAMQSKDKKILRAYIET